MFNGVVPDEVEQTLSEQGIDKRVWNLSLHGLDSFEQKKILRDVLDYLPKLPEVIVIEPCMSIGVSMGNITTTRSVYFSDWNGLVESWRFTSSANRSLAHKCYNLSCLLVRQGVGLLNYGTLSDRLFPERFSLESSYRQVSQFISNRGYQKASDRFVGVVRQRADLDGVVDEAMKQEKGGHEGF